MIKYKNEDRCIKTLIRRYAHKYSNPKANDALKNQFHIKMIDKKGNVKKVNVRTYFRNNKIHPLLLELVLERYYYIELSIGHTHDGEMYIANHFLYKLPSYLENKVIVNRSLQPFYDKLEDKLLVNNTRTIINDPDLGGSYKVAKHNGKHKPYTMNSVRLLNDDGLMSGTKYKKLVKYTGVNKRVLGIFRLKGYTVSEIRTSHNPKPIHLIVKDANKVLFSIIHNVTDTDLKHFNRIGKEMMSKYWNKSHKLNVHVGQPIRKYLKLTTNALNYKGNNSKKYGDILSSSIRYINEINIYSNEAPYGIKGYINNQSKTVISIIRHRLLKHN